MDEQAILDAAEALRAEAREVFPNERFLSVHIAATAGAFDSVRWTVSVSGNGASEIARAWDVESIAAGIADVRQKLRRHIKPSDAWAIIGAVAA